MERRPEDTNEREETTEHVDLEDETDGASSPPPDENVVDEIGEEVGVRYQDEEPLHPVDKVASRDERRWELDPASSEDYPERAREQASSTEAESPDSPESPGPRNHAR